MAAGGSASVAGEPAGKRSYPLVKGLAADRIPVAVTLGYLPQRAKRAGEPVLKLSRQPHYRWLGA